MSDLFRSEAIEFRESRDFGEVAVSVPFAANLIWLVIVAIFTIVLLTSIIGQTSRVERVRGWVRPDNFVVRDYAQQNLYITRVHVLQGADVVKGQPILEASPLTAADRDPAIRDRLTEAMTQEEAELRSQLVSLNQSDRIDGGRVRSQLAANESKQRTAQRVSDIQRQQIALASEAVESARQLLERGYLSKLEWQRRRERLLDAQQQLLVSEEAMTGIASERARLGAEAKENRARTSRQVSEVQRALIELGRRRLAFRMTQGFKVVAPSNGRIAVLHIRAGETVKRGALQFVLVPGRTRLIAELFVPTRSAANLRVNQTVQVQFDAFPATIYGTRTGRIIRASDEALGPDELPSGFPATESAYKAEVELEAAPLGQGRAITLRPGMMLSADLILERSPIWRALLPLFKPSERRP